MRIAPALAAALLLAAFPPVASADDLIQLKDGRIVDGVKMSKEEGAVVLHYVNGDVRVPLEQIQDFVIEGSPAPEPTTPEEIEKKALGLFPWKGKWVTAAVRDKERKKETEAKKKAIEEYRKHREWKDRYQFKTKNFEFQSTQPPEINAEYSELLEAYFKEFSKTWKVSVPQKWGRLPVCFYGSREDFARTGGLGGGVLAYYRFVAPRELNFYYDRSDPEYSVACLFHEGNHYLTALMDERFQYPHWVNEAMAEYYGASVWDPATKTMKIGGVQQGRLAEVQNDMADGKFLSAQDLVTSMAGAYEHYYWGWSFVHFLMESPKYKLKFMRFFSDLANGKDVQRVAHRSFSDLTMIKDGNEILRVFLTRMGMKEQDLPNLQKEWYDHIKSMEASGLRGLEEGGVRAFSKGMWKFRAPRLLKEAIEKGSRKANVWNSYTWCLAAKGDPAARAEALASAEKATSLLPMESSVWAARGYVTYIAGMQDAGKKFVELAREMDPESDYYDPDNWVKIQGATGSGE